jgi:hypothetical protein
LITGPGRSTGSWPPGRDDPGLAGGRWRRPPLPLAEIELLGFALLASSVIGRWHGIRDLLMPSSTTGQLVGLALSLAGLAGLAGVAALRGIRGPLMDQYRWFGRQHGRTAAHTGG